MMSISNGASFNLSGGDGSAIRALAAGQYPEPWWFRLQCPVQPGAVR